MNTQFVSKQRAFTLIEILVVIAIIGILSAIVYASFSQARAQSRDKQRVVDLGQIQLALKLYQTQNGHYPLENDGFSGGTVGKICKSCSGPINDVIKQYLGSLPEDPKNDATHFYYYDERQACGGEPNQTVLFAATMETSAYKNANQTICNSYGGEGIADKSNAHIIMLGPSQD